MTPPPEKAWIRGYGTRTTPRTEGALTTTTMHQSTRSHDVSPAAHGTYSRATLNNPNGLIYEDELVDPLASEEEPDEDEIDSSDVDSEVCDYEFTRDMNELKSNHLATNQRHPV